MSTSEQVARLAGVSRATVSRVLNGSSNVSNETRKRIYEAVATLGYETNALRRIIPEQRSGMIALALFGSEEGLNLSQLTSTECYFYLEMLKHFERELGTLGYDFLLLTHPYGPSAESDDPEVNYLQALHARRVEGVITMALHTNDRRFPALCRSTIPTVFIDTPFQSKYAASVKSDYIDGARQATEHLLQLGHRRIAFFTGDLASTTGTERLMGQQQAMARAGLIIDPQLICQTGWNTNDAYEAMLRLLSERRDFTAVVASSDMLALGVMAALKKHRIRIPEDVSIIGFDDIDLSETADPPLTTIHQDKERLSKEAVAALMRLIQGKEALEPLIIPTRLLVRSSTAPAK